VQGHNVRGNAAIIVLCQLIKHHMQQVKPGNTQRQNHNTRQQSVKARPVRSKLKWATTKLQVSGAADYLHLASLASRVVLQLRQTA
jgi:hypothetical protein